MSQARYCSVQFALQQVEGVYSYLEHLESQMSRSPEPEPTALTDAQRNRLVSAEEKLRDAVRSRQQMKDLKYPSDWVRAGLHNGPSPSEEMVGLLSLELDVRTYVVEEINTLAEAAWSIRPLDGFAERVNKCAAEAVDHGLGFVNTADRNCMNRTLLEDAAAGVAYHWTEKARTAFPPLWGQSPGKTGQTGSDLNVTIRVQREGEGESQREPHPFYEYPKWKYHWNREATVVKSLEEEKALGVGWADSPAAFDPYKGARPARTEGQDPVKWVDEWSVPGLLPDHRKRIKAQLLRADGAFERSPDPEAAVPKSMRQGFDGVAGVLFDGGILTEDLLRKEIPALVWDSAIAGGWWRFASETRQDIFPEQLGHYWVWRDESQDWPSLFRAETAEWRAGLLSASPSTETPAPTAAALDPKAGDRVQVPALNPFSQGAKEHLQLYAWWDSRQKSWTLHDRPMDADGKPDPYQSVPAGSQATRSIKEAARVAISRLRQSRDPEIRALAVTLREPLYVWFDLMRAKERGFRRTPQLTSWKGGESMEGFMESGTVPSNTRMTENGAIHQLFFESAAFWDDLVVLGFDSEAAPRVERRPPNAQEPSTPEQEVASETEPIGPAVAQGSAAGQPPVLGGVSEDTIVHGEPPSNAPEDRLARFMQQNPGTTYADIRYSSQVHKPDFQDWRRGRLASTSVMFRRIEGVIAGTTSLQKKPRKSRAD